MSFDHSTIVSAGTAFALWVNWQIGLRDWVREVEADMLYHDPDGMR